MAPQKRRASFSVASKMTADRSLGNSEAANRRTKDLLAITLARLHFFIRTRDGNEMQTQQWLEKLFASIDARQTNEFVGFLSADALFRYGSNVDVHGREAIAACVDYVFTTFRASSHQLLRHWDTADVRIAQGVVTYTRLDGAQVTIPFVNVFYLRGDKVARYLIYIDNGPLFA